MLSLKWHRCVVSMLLDTVHTYLYVRRYACMCTYIEVEFESLFLEIETPNILIGEVYRLPNTSETISIDRYNKPINNIMETKLNVIIAKDQNMDLLKIEINKYSSDLFDIFFTNGIIPTITRLTRITHTSATLIDNIYIRHNCMTNITSAIIITDISDHLPILAYFGSKIEDKPENLTFKYRCNRLKCPLARLSGLQCLNMGHNGHGINLYVVVMIIIVPDTVGFYLCFWVHVIG